MNNGVFVSYHTSSSIHIVESVVGVLEANGVECWYAPRDTEGDYAGSIARAIKNCRVFLLILNKEASNSPHVLNELDLVTNRISKKEEVTIIPFHVADDDISDEASYYIGRMHWLNAMTGSMEENVLSLCDKIGQIFDKTIDNRYITVQKANKLISKIPSMHKNFTGKETVFKHISDQFGAGNKVVFLEGESGVGKSDIAVLYGWHVKPLYDNIVYTKYNGSLKGLVLNQGGIEITNLARADESDDEFFAKKLSVLQSICGEKTLIIVDDYNVVGDPDFDVFTAGNYNVLFVSNVMRNGFATVKLQKPKVPVTPVNPVTPVTPVIPVTPINPVNPAGKIVNPKLIEKKQFGGIWHYFAAVCLFVAMLFGFEMFSESEYESIVYFDITLKQVLCYAIFPITTLLLSILILFKNSTAGKVIIAVVAMLNAALSFLLTVGLMQKLNNFEWAYNNYYGAGSYENYEVVPGNQFFEQNEVGNKMFAHLGDLRTVIVCTCIFAVMFGIFSLVAVCRKKTNKLVMLIPLLPLLVAAGLVYDLHAGDTVEIAYTFYAWGMFFALMALSKMKVKPKVQPMQMPAQY